MKVHELDFAQTPQAVGPSSVLQSYLAWQPGMPAAVEKAQPKKPRRRPGTKPGSAS